MKKVFSVFVLLVLCTTTVVSQRSKDVIIEIDGEPVYASEFTRVYLKNLDLVQKESQKDVDGYLDLFIDYKLKIAEASAQGLDQEEAYVSEFQKYRNQLSRNYLYEDKLTADMAREAYERGKEEIDASHILILVGYDALPQDTLKAYNKIKSVREKALKGEDFATLAQKYSEEPNANQSAGRLGYFTAFSMVYPFETEAYNTPVGEVSNIVRTSFGYHIIKVHDRRERLPKILVSHIMISDKKGARNFDPKERANEILTMYKQGRSFEELAMEYSDDEASGKQGGKLVPFTKGELRSPEFEDAAYTLKKIGEVSEPIQSDFGWHIIRLDEVFEEESFEEQKEFLEKRASQGDRARSIATTINNEIKQKYGFKSDPSYFQYFENYIPDSVLARKWVRSPIPASENKTLFTIGDKKVAYSDFAKYIEERQKSIAAQRDKSAFLIHAYDEFETQEVREYFKDRLEKENEEYAAILQEYRDGLLIFDVMEHNIWSKAKTDSLGLEAFYQKNKQNYKWKKRVDADVYSANSQEIAQRVQYMLQEGKDIEEIRMELNPPNTVNVMVTQGVFEVDQSVLPNSLELKTGVSKIYPRNNSYTIVNIKNVLPEGIKELQDARGVIVSDYQNQLEKDWMKSLHKKYDVKVNQRTLKRLKRTLE
mgnify:CR=1 FL=1|jgi:peptidyl-prolyl cis-trans isomerase SurA